MTYLLLSIQFVVAGVFALSAAGKLRARAEFAASLAEFGVPSGARRPAGVAIMAAELAIVPLVLVPATALAALVLAAALLAIFAAAVALALRRGRRPRCRCFGVASAPLRRAHVGRNLGLALVAAVGAVAAGAADPTTLDLAPLAVAVLVATLAVFAVAGFDDIVEIVAPTHHHP